MPTVVLQKPTIQNQFPLLNIKFGIKNGRLISEQCTISVKVNFLHGDEMDCGLTVGISKSQNNYFKIEPNTQDSNMFEIYRHYGIIGNGMMDTFTFYLVPQQSLDAIKAWASPVILVVTAHDCSNSNIKREQRIYLNVI